MPTHEFRDLYSEPMHYFSLSLFSFNYDIDRPL